MASKEYTFDSFGEVSVKADVYTKTNQTGAVQPIAIVFYGGGFVVGSKDAVSKHEINHLLDLGFIVVVPDYRHSPSVSVYNGAVQDAHKCYTWVQTDLPKLLSNDSGIVADTKRIAVIGFSAGGTLALHLASAKQPPKAIVAFYSAMYFDDAFWTTPMSIFAKVPTFPQEFLDKVVEEGTVVSAGSSFKKVPGSPAPVPDFSKPRTAWLLSHLRDGTWLPNVVQDGDYRRIDPAELFSGTFPPSCFVHGSDDKMCEPKFSEWAHEALSAKNVESKLIMVEGEGHNFDTAIPIDDPKFEVIRDAFQFAAKQVAL